MEQKYLKLLKAINEYEGTEAFDESQITRAETNSDGTMAVVEVANSLGKVRAVYQNKGFLDGSIVMIQHKSLWEEDWVTEEENKVDSDYLG